jgi:hypothetical protein
MLSTGQSADNPGAAVQQAIFPSPWCMGGVASSAVALFCRSHGGLRAVLHTTILEAILRAPAEMPNFANKAA